MKIVSGQFGGRRLQVPKNRDIRPTSDKIRGAIFNMLHSRGAIEDAVVLDTFCGTGALGFEALSRGAGRCTFIDKAKSSLELAKENARALEIENSCAFLLKDAMKLQNCDRKDGYNLVFLDPPYHQNLIPRILSTLMDGGWFAPQAFIICESEKGFNVFAQEGFNIEDEKLYGDTKITLLALN